MTEELLLGCNISKPSNVISSSVKKKERQNERKKTVLYGDFHLELKLLKFRDITTLCIWSV